MFWRSHTPQPDVFGRTREQPEVSLTASADKVSVEWAVPGLNRGPSDFQSLELNSQHPVNTTLAPPPAVGRSAGRSDDESEGGNDDPDLARLIAAWPTLPEPIRRAMLAILEAAT